MEAHIAGVTLGRDRAGEEFLQCTHIVDVNLIALRTVCFPITIFSFVGPARTLGTNRILDLNLLDHFLLLVIRGSFESRTVLDSLQDSFCSSLGFIFMCWLVADRTHFVSTLDDCSILGLVTFARM